VTADVLLHIAPIGVIEASPLEKPEGGEKAIIRIPNEAKLEVLTEPF
jgi:hypothetical protein